MKNPKRLTKKDVYAKYGIVYDPKAQTILTPIGPMKELLKKGNSKTGAAVKTWSMNQSTCPMHCVGCYADAGCHKCSECEYVLFVEHSTEYVATEDPRYAELVELVENQEF